MKYNLIIICLLTISCLQLNGQTSPVGKVKKGKDCTVAVYYFPNYHSDSINARWHGKGWTEWEVVKAAKSRFKGIDVFTYDWYWYSNTDRYLVDGLEKVFLKPPNRNRLEFALMWANADWLNIQPATFDNDRIALTQGAVSHSLWDTISTYIVEKYFKQPNYWKIDGKPYFSIYSFNINPNWNNEIRKPRMSHRSDIDSLSYDEYFNRGIRRGKSILVTGDKPAFALMQYLKQDKLDPDLIKMDDGKMRIKINEREEWLHLQKKYTSCVQPSFYWIHCKHFIPVECKIQIGDC